MASPAQESSQPAPFPSPWAIPTGVQSRHQASLLKSFPHPVTATTCLRSLLQKNPSKTRPRSPWPSALPDVCSTPSRPTLRRDFLSRSSVALT